MDGDMQHPPEVIPQLLEEYANGYSIVNTRRIDSAKTGLIKRITSRWYYKLINALSDVPIEPASADFRLMSREAVNSMLAMPERKRFTRGLVSWMGFHQSIIDYEVGDRLSGKSKFTFFKMLRFGIDGVTSFSVKPLRIAFYVGTLISLLAILYGVYAIVIFLLGHAVQGWTSLLVSVLFIGGATLLSLGIIGEYIARIYNEVRRRPMYFIKDSTDRFKE
jgi:dolichol-phosphate mannosyltransferase